MQELDARLNVSVHGQYDAVDRTFVYTTKHIAQQRARARGYITACTQPVILQAAIAQLHVQRNIFVGMCGCVCVDLMHA